MNGVLDLETLGERSLILVTVLVIVAALVNTIPRAQRRHLGRAAGLTGLFLLFVGLSASAVWLDMGPALRALQVLRELTGALALASFFVVLVFDVSLPALRIKVVDITAELASAAIYLIASLSALAVADVDLTSLVAASSVVAAVLTISLQSTLGAVIGGVALQVDNPFAEGDWVQTREGRQGRVRSVGWRTTQLETRDGMLMVVPNSILMADFFLVLGRRNGVAHPYRLSVDLQVDFKHSPGRVIEVVEKALRDSPIPNVAENPAPDCICISLSRDNRDSFALYQARVWILDPARDDPATSAVRVRVYNALRRAGISLARPTFDVTTTNAADNTREARQLRRAHEALHRVALFQGLEESEQEELAAELIHAPFAAGETITRQGAVAHWLYLLSEGTVEVRIHGEDLVDVPVTRLHAPNFFGEMGLMTGEPRVASIVAVTDVDCWRLDRAAFEAVLRRRPQIAEQVAQVLAQRRVDLEAAREGETPNERGIETERVAILGRVKSFFGLD